MDPSRELTFPAVPFRQKGSQPPSNQPNSDSSCDPENMLFSTISRTTRRVTEKGLPIAGF